MSERFPLLFNLSTCTMNFSIFPLSKLFFSANLIAILFNSLLDEYFLGIFSSIKLNMHPHFSCPMVGVDGFADVFM